MDKEVGELKDKDKQFTQCEYSIYIGRTNSILHKTSVDKNLIVHKNTVVNKTKILHHNAKILNVFWTLIASKKRIEQLLFFDWLSNVKNLVLSNGCELLRNVIQWDQNSFFFQKRTKITQRLGVVM